MGKSEKEREWTSVERGEGESQSEVLPVDCRKEREREQRVERDRGEVRETGKRDRHKEQ